MSRLPPVDLTDLHWDVSDPSIGCGFTLTPQERTRGVIERDLCGLLDVQVRVRDRICLAINLVKIRFGEMQRQGPLTAAQEEEIADLYLAKAHAMYWATVLTVRGPDDDDSDREEYSDEEEDDSEYLVRSEDPYVCPSYCPMLESFWVKKRAVVKVEPGCRRSRL